MQKTITFPDQQSNIEIFGPRDIYLRQLAEAFDVKIVCRGSRLRVEGDKREVQDCLTALDKMRETVQKNQKLGKEDVAAIINSDSGYYKANSIAGEVGEEFALTGFDGSRPPKPKTQAQAKYMKSITENDIVFCIGPAGTGKTYLAVAVALDYLNRGELKRIILCRPAVEAGEHLGYLPGDLRSKVNPYLRPLYDALHDFIPRATLEDYIENDLIEILPLAFVRGRTLDNAFIILDEAQNCTVGQMKTFLTRLGSSAKLVVTGDITQVDLPHEQQSGLVDVQERLDGIEGISFFRLHEDDIVRHRLVKQIVGAYQRESGPGPERRYRK